ncbi:hypothetical protein EV122DRAFT_295324 [Schizophyllum commune]
MVVEAAHAVDLVGLVPPTQDFAVFDKIFEGPEEYNETLRRSGHHTSTLILERALITTFLKHKIAREKRFRLVQLGRFLAGHRIADILFNFPGSELLEGDEGLKTVVFHTYLGLMLSLRTHSTEGALMKIYVSLIEAAIAAPEPSSEGIEEEENTNKTNVLCAIFRYPLSSVTKCWTIVDRRPGEKRVDSESKRLSGIRGMRYILDDTIEGVGEPVL